MDNIVVSDEGGKRKKIGEAWHLIPFVGLLWVARVLYKGAFNYAPSQWKKLDPNNLDMHPLNHGIRHYYKALESPPGSNERIWQIAKGVTNGLFQIWFEENKPEREE